MKNGKRATQKVWIALQDDSDGGYQAKITFTPSIQGREVKENSPSLNAAARLWLMLSERKTELGNKLPENERIVIVPKRFE